MEKLYVLYDPKCELCERLKDWLLYSGPGWDSAWCRQF